MRERIARLAGRSVALAALATVPGCSSPMPAPSSPWPSPDRQGAPAVTRGAPEDRFVDSLLALMTLEEKLGQLNQLSGMGEPTGPGGTPAGLGQIQRGEVGSFLNVVGADSTRKLQRIAVDSARLGIPLIFALDVIHGYRTIFPVPLAEASSWDTSAVRGAARIAAVEADANGVHWTFAPMVDVARDPRWGRVVEGAGEDPYLGSAMAVARVRGFQGGDPARRGSIIATVKHFAAYGAAEGGRDYNIADVPERTLREVYLPPFHAAVCAGAQTLMAAFNEVAGVPAHASRWLLTDVLRGEWGFDGAVVGDWAGVAELIPHGVAADRAAAAALALRAGVDIEMVSETYVRDLPPLVRDRRVDPASIDDAVRRMLRLKYRAGLFSDPYRSTDTLRARTATLTAAHRAAARDMARRSIVLLKNDGDLLPLRKDVRTIAVIGPLAADSNAVIGNWAAFGRGEDAVSVLSGIRRAVAPTTRVLHARGTSATGPDTAGIAEAVRVARRADVVILVIGETPDLSAEASSRSSLELPGMQQRLVDAVVASGKPVVVVLMNGRPLAIPRVHDRVPAILETWFLGIEAGTATADVLFGDHNPSGKLPVTFPRAVGQVPIYYAARNTGRPSSAEKYTSRYLDLPSTPLYPFGHGLSYTRFRYGVARVSPAAPAAGDTIRVDIDVTNAGARAGDETVQLYVQDPVASVTRPLKQLRGFERISLAPGETRTVRFALTADDLAFHDLSMRRVVEPGAFKVHVGASSADVQEAMFRLRTPGDVAMPVPVASCGH